eukprot:jgi/Chlat1/3195/Chrsp22S03482
MAAVAAAAAEEGGPGTTGSSASAGPSVGVRRSKELLQAETSRPLPSGLLLSNNGSVNVIRGCAPAGAAPAFRTPQPSAVMSRLQAFLPELALANAQLEAAMQDRSASEFDIEVASDDPEAQQVIMDVALGVVELKNDAAVQAAERAISGGGDVDIPAVNMASEDSSSDDGSDSESDISDGGDVGEGEKDHNDGEVVVNKAQAGADSKKRKKPAIEVL